MEITPVTSGADRWDPPIELSVPHQALSTVLASHRGHLLQVCSLLLPCTEVCNWENVLSVIAKIHGSQCVLCTLFIHSPLPSVTFLITLLLEMRDGIIFPPSKKKGEEEWSICAIWNRASGDFDTLYDKSASRDNYCYSSSTTAINILTQENL